MVADKAKIPQLSRIIVSIDSEVAMEKSLAMALTKLQQKLTGVTETGLAKSIMETEAFSKSKK
jgi:prefoldin subunit 5